MEFRVSSMSGEFCDACCRPLQLVVCASLVMCGAQRGKEDNIADNRDKTNSVASLQKHSLKFLFGISGIANCVVARALALTLSQKNPRYFKDRVLALGKTVWSSASVL
jgi:hypothetical protein